MVLVAVVVLVCVIDVAVFVATVVVIVHVVAATVVVIFAKEVTDLQADINYDRKKFDRGS